MIVVADTSPIHYLVQLGEAGRRGLPFTGTLGVLAAADKIGKVDGLKTYSRLISETSFRSSSSLEKRFLEDLRRSPSALS
jgi:predicted nucleic acid-binding protein